MAKEEKEFVDIARGRVELADKLKKWENTIRRDGRDRKGWTVRKVSRGGNPPVWWIYLIGPKK
jgi:hypothetical protein